MPPSKGTGSSIGCPEYDLCKIASDVKDLISYAVAAAWLHDCSYGTPDVTSRSVAELRAIDPDGKYHKLMYKLVNVEFRLKFDPADDPACLSINTNRTR